MPAEQTSNQKIRLALQQATESLDLVQERARLLLWVPVVFGIGIAFYFSLRFEPDWRPVALALAFLLLAVVTSWRWPGLRVCLLACTLILLGFLAASWRTAEVSTELWTGPERAVAVTAAVKSAERRAKGGVSIRLVDIRPVREGRAAPSTARLVVRTNMPDVRPGDQVRLMAVFTTPPGSASPGAYNYARRAYFEEISALGYAVSEVVLLKADSASPFWAGLRQTIAARIDQHMPPREAGVAIALMTGDRAGIDPADLEAIRAAGIAHMLAISGLHVGLIAGFVFTLTRLGCLLIPVARLQVNARKWGAMAAFMAGLGYMLLTDAALPTQRAVIMLGIVCLAVLLDRLAISLRNVALAATFILLLAPEALLSVSFQMSFAAVTALVAAYEYIRDRRSIRVGQPGVIVRIARYFGAILLTSLIAGAATDIFAAYHFNRVALLGILGNLIGLPVLTVVVMPAMLSSFLLMPLGWEAAAFWVMQQGISLILEGAHFVARQPLAVGHIAAFPGWILGLMAFSGLWLCLWTHRMRWLGVPGLLLAVVAIATTPVPDLLISEDGNRVALRLENGAAISNRSGRILRETWQRQFGVEDLLDWPTTVPNLVRAGLSDQAPVRCDAAGCIFYMKGKHPIQVAWIRDRAAVREDCSTADIVIAEIPLPRSCRAALIIDRFDLWRYGAHAIRLDRSGGPARVTRVWDHIGDRPWSILPGERRE